MRSAMRRQRGGFTLFEIVIVLGLLTIMAGFAWPLYQDRIRQSAMPESAQRMRDLLFMAKSEAQAKNRRVRIRFEPLKQQPIIEIETDPVFYPNQWDALEEMWTRETMLLDDVQVHRIEPGRPIYLIPISEQENAEAVEEDIDEEEAIAEDFDATISSAATADDVEVDLDRPMLVFEADGSSDWATLIISQKPLKEELLEEDDQIWIVLDGRTGIASIRPKVTQEQLADPEFYINRDKLELPLDADVDDLSLAMFDPATEAAGGSFGGGGPFDGQSATGEGGFGGGDGGGVKVPDDLAGELPIGKDGDTGDVGQGQGPGRRPGMRRGGQRSGDEGGFGQRGGQRSGAGLGTGENGGRRPGGNQGEGGRPRANRRGEGQGEGQPGFGNRPGNRQDGPRGNRPGRQEGPPGNGPRRGARDGQGQTNGPSRQNDTGQKGG